MRELITSELKDLGLLTAVKKVSQRINLDLALKKCGIVATHSKVNGVYLVHVYSVRGREHVETFGGFKTKIGAFEVVRSLLKHY